VNLIGNLYFVLALSTADQRALDRFSPTLRFYYDLTQNAQTANWMLYITITALSILVYKLGFAKKLSILKSAVIYLFLLSGCLMLSFLAIFLPIAEGLMVAALILIIYKIRLNREKKSGTI